MTNSKPPMTSVRGRLTRRSFLVVATGSTAALVVGCGTDNGSGTSGAESEDDSSAPSDIGTSTAEQAVTQSDELLIVDLSDFSFDLSALGATPIANVYGPEFLTGIVDSFALSDQAKAELLAATNAAPAFELNVEQVLELQPDLVITSPINAQFFGTAMEQLGEGIDIVILEDDVPWQQRSRQTAAAIGADGALDERIEAAEAAVVELADKVETAGLGGTEVSILRSFDGALTALVPPSTASSILAEIGMTQPPAQLVAQPSDSIQPGYAAEVPFSGEQLSEHNAAALVVLNSFDLSSPTAEWPPGYPPELIPVLSDGPSVVGNYFAWALNSVLGVESIISDLNRLVDNMS